MNPRRAMPLIGTAVLSLALAGCPTAEPEAPVDEPVDDTPFPHLTDDQGRVLILHGMNVMSASKGAEDRMPPIDESVVQRMAVDWGFNLSRFLIFWDHVEPSPGEIDGAYLDAVELRLDWFAAADIHVVLDMHQDVYAERFCCDGAPGWAIRDDDQPFELQDQWFLNYFQPAVQRSFDNFFAYDHGDHADLQDHYADAWAAVAERLGDHPAVIGYDLMNEPHPGTWLDIGELLGGEANPDGLHAEFDRDRLQPFHQRVIDRIREVDTERWIFYETRYGAPGNGLPSYAPVLDDPRPGPDRLAYFPHLYSLQIESSEIYDPDTDTAIPDWETHRTAEAAEQDCPLLIGEWGMNTDLENAHQALADTLAMADRATAGWAYWSLDPGSWGIVDGDWNERDVADLLVRPYPRAVAGVPISYGFDPETRVFTLEWTERAGISGPTGIYLPAARHYPEGWELSLSDPEGSWSSDWDADRETLWIEVADPETTHAVTIRPAS